MSSNALNSSTSLINCYLIFDNGIKGKILSFDSNKNALVLCNTIVNSSNGIEVRIAFCELDSTIDDWLNQSFSERDLAIYLEYIRFYLSNLKEGECYNESQIAKNNEIEYWSRAGAISYKQAIALGAKRGIIPSEVHSSSLFDNITRGGCWMSTAFSNHHVEHLTQAYVLSGKGMISSDDYFNGRKVSPLVCVSGDVLYDGGIGSSNDPIRVIKKRQK